MTIRGAGLYGGTPPAGPDPEALARALDEADARRWAEAAYAEMLAEPGWPADVRSAPCPGDPELEAAEAEI